jgi:hypothetical protein
VRKSTLLAPPPSTCGTDCLHPRQRRHYCDPSGTDRQERVIGNRSGLALKDQTAQIASEKSTAHQWLTRPSTLTSTRRGMSNQGRPIADAHGTHGTQAAAALSQLLQRDDPQIELIRD